MYGFLDWDGGFLSLPLPIKELSIWQRLAEVERYPIVQLWLE
jgi:hypothetical protein